MRQGVLMQTFRIEHKVACKRIGHHENAEEEEDGSDFGGEIREHEYSQHHGIEKDGGGLAVPAGTVHRIGLAEDKKTEDEHEQFTENKEGGEPVEEGVTGSEAENKGKLGGFIGDGIEQFSEIGNHMEAPCNDAIGDVGKAGEKNKTDGDQIFIGYKSRNDKRNEQESEEADGIGDGKNIVFGKTFSYQMIHSMPFLR